MVGEAEIFDSDPDYDGISAALGVIALIVGLADAITGFGLIVMSLLTGEDLALKGLGIRLAWLVAALFLLTAGPALGLAYFGRAARLSLILGCAFPLLFMIMYGGLTLAFA